MTSGRDEILGARPLSDTATRFCVWAPASERVALLRSDQGDSIELLNLGDGYFAATVADCPVGTRYRYVLDGDALADAASRSQPEGVHGPSEVIDLAAHDWGDGSFHQRPLWDHVIYELHVGTFTAEGTFDAALQELDDLAELGVSAIELMPVAQFPGERNWGYDGVFPFAVQHSYGGAHGLQRFVDSCHQKGLAVILDVVYNHLGPEGNVLGAYGPYFSDRYRTPWGDAVNFDGAGSDDVRHYFWLNARQWFADFHVDALRLDAVHAIIDQTATTFIEELSRQSQDLSAALGRRCELIAESAANDPRTVTERADGGVGMDAQWNDDFHHALHVALTGERSGYYVDYEGAFDVARAMDEGFVLQGAYSPFRRCHHGAPSTRVAPERFVVFAQNHDHIGNRPKGDRLVTLVSPAQARLAAAAVVLAPNVPLLFMGEEYGETAPFPYFVDHGDPELIAATRAGRAREFADVAEPGELFDPADPATFNAARLDRSQRHLAEQGARWSLYRDLIALRRTTPALRRSARASARAWCERDVVTLLRTHDAGDVVVFFNFGESDATAYFPSRVRGRNLLDRAASVIEPGANVKLAPWEFDVYQLEVSS